MGSFGGDRMIELDLGAEPGTLPPIREKELTKLRVMFAPTSDDIPGSYREVAQILWERQEYKCCYCEKVVPRKFNDVEHYRPKGRANRTPGCTKTHGYWWLAYSWNNLLFACNFCNRTGKNDDFPLDVGSTSLSPEEYAPGKEIPLLINPRQLNPVEHIKFVLRSKFPNGPRHWMAEPRNGSKIALHTIRSCDLNRDELLELRTRYVENFISPQVKRIRKEIEQHNVSGITSSFERAQEMCLPRFEFAALSYDIFYFEFSKDPVMLRLGLLMPEPASACR
jgi:uncharacterized protein (TIGR02646 family)